MSLVPLLLNDFLEDFSRPMYSLGGFPHLSLVDRPRSCCPRKRHQDSSLIDTRTARPFNKDDFRINLDVQQFKPEELKVTLENDHLVIRGKHEEKQDDHGFISREFTRRYTLPQDIDSSAFTSNLSSDGVLTLHAPKKMKKDDKSIELPITITNHPVTMATTEENKENKPHPS